MSNASSILSSAEPKMRECPACQQLYPDYLYYVPWCECGWGLKLPEPEHPPTTFEKLFAKAGERLGTGLFEELSKAEALRPRWTPSKIGAYAIALLVHGITLSFIILVLLIFVRWGVNLVTIFVGIFCVYLAWSFSPEFGKLERPQFTRAQLPMLHAIIERVTKALNAKPIDGLVIDERYNASFGHIGLQRKVILTLGLPYFWVLSGRERVSLIAHELAHGINGDPSYGFFTGTAINTLIEWYRTLYPYVVFNPEGGFTGLLMIPVNLVRRVLAKLVIWLAQLQAVLLYREHQRAEYLADSLAAQISSTATIISTLEKLYLYNIASLVIQQIAVRHLDALDLFEELRRAFAITPARELERIHRLSQMEALRLDVTHPPTAKRIAMLQAHPIAEPKVVVSDEEWAQVEAEFAPLKKAYQDFMLANYRSALG